MKPSFVCSLYHEFEWKLNTKKLHWLQNLYSFWLLLRCKMSGHFSSHRNSRVANYDHRVLARITTGWIASLPTSEVTYIFACCKNEKCTFILAKLTEPFLVDFDDESVASFDLLEGDQNKNESNDDLHFYYFSLKEVFSFAFLSSKFNDFWKRCCQFERRRDID